MLIEENETFFVITLLPGFHTKILEILLGDCICSSISDYHPLLVPTGGG